MSSQPSTAQANGNVAHGSFLSSINEIRKRARQAMEEGAVTPSYSLDKDKVVELLNEALATELVCVLRYRRHYYMAEGIHSESIKKEFMTHASEELGHADQIAERIVQLGGEPDFAPDVLSARSHSEYQAGTDLRDMLRENLVAERIAIESYREMINFIGDHDSTTRRMLEDILATEEHHADDMASLIKRVG
ncbi:MAG: bacterioferritin [Burkholderiaceae bacterium]